MNLFGVEALTLGRSLSIARAMSSQASDSQSAKPAPTLSDRVDFAAGDVIEAVVEDLSRGGSGVIRSEGRVVFVPKTAPGDRVRVRVLSIQKRWAEGELLEVLEPSALRIQPRCPVFGRCGGCQWQHLPYEYQWKTKLSGARHALDRVGLHPANPVWLEFPAKTVWEYRNRIQLRGEGQELGFFEPGTRSRVPIERCDIARPEINQRLPEVKVQGSKRDGEYKVEVEVLPSGQVRDMWNLRHAAGGFRQVHDEQNEVLQNAVRELLFGSGVQDSKAVRLWDLYGGAGNLSRPVMNFFRSVDCVDTGSPSAKPEGFCETFKFHRSPVLPWLKRQKLNSECGPLWVILDPPRAGLDSDGGEIVSLLARHRVQKIVAVGCDADSWARDLSRFSRNGWSLETAGALDLFPQTPHVESLALLVRKS